MLLASHRPSVYLQFDWLAVIRTGQSLPTALGSEIIPPTPAGLDAGITNKALRVIEGGREGRLRHLGDLTEASVAHEAVVSVTTRASTIAPRWNTMPAACAQVILGD
jgi:hypothetical protein